MHIPICNFPEKSILSIQISFDENNRDDSVIISSVLTTRGYNIIQWPPRFDSTDYWWEDDSMGKCGPYSGECIGEGAVQQLESKINMNICPSLCPSGHGYYTDYTNVSITEDIIPQLTDPNSPYGYRVPYFYAGVDEYTCMSPDDLNYYLMEALELINEFRPINYVPVSMTNLYMYAVPIGYHLAFHEYTFTYGAYHCFSGDDN